MSGILNVLLATFGSGSSPVGFLASLSNSNGSSVTDPYLAIRNDQLNLVVATSDAGVTQMTVLQMDLDAAITWQTTLADSADFPVSSDISIDSTGNVVVVGRKYQTSFARNNGYAVKLNGSGVVQWQRRSDSSSRYYGAAIDTSDNIYCVGSIDADMYVTKFDSSGTVSYQRRIGDSLSEIAYSVAIRSSTDFVATGIVGSGGFAFYDGFYLSCYLSTGATSAGRDQRDAEGNKRQEGKAVIAGESDGIFYNAVEIYTASSIAQSVIIKYSNTGTVLWQRLFQASISSLYLSVAALCMDPSQTHVYMCGYTGNTLQLAKFTASTGSLVWQRTLSSTTNLYATDISVDSLDNIYVTMNSSPAGTFLLKMPGSGAGVGNSVVLGGVTFTYAETTNFSSSAATTGFSYAPSNNSNSTTVATPSATSSTGTLAVTSEEL